MPRRAQGNIATPGIAAQIAQTMEDTGARLVIVLGHTECAAVDRAIDKWLDRTASVWPWLSQTASLHYPPTWQPLKSLGPPKPPSEKEDKNAKDEATRSDKIDRSGIKACPIYSPAYKQPAGPSQCAAKGLHDFSGSQLLRRRCLDRRQYIQFPQGNSLYR